MCTSLINFPWIYFIDLNTPVGPVFIKLFIRDCESTVIRWHNCFSWFLQIAMILLKFLNSWFQTTLTGNNEWEIWISLDFNFRAVSEPRDLLKLNPTINKDVTVYSINFSFSAVIRVCKFHQDRLLSKLMTVLKYKIY